MKKEYIAPEVFAIAFQTENSILFGSNGDRIMQYDDEETGANEALSTKWGASSWTESDEDEL